MWAWLAKGRVTSGGSERTEAFVVLTHTEAMKEGANVSALRTLVTLAGAEPSAVVEVLDLELVGPVRDRSSGL